METDFEKFGIITDYLFDDVRRRVNGEYSVTADPGRTHNWKKKSIFFELPYWKHVVIPHNLDVMHIESNLCNNILSWLLDDSRSNKFILNAHRDLERIGIRQSMHPQLEKNGKAKAPKSSYTMDNDKKDIFLKVLKEIRVPDGYCSNISRCVNINDRTISGLKSHDCHIIMQLLLPIAARKALPEEVAQVFIELSSFFR